MRALVCVVGLLVGGAFPTQAQWLDPDTCWTCSDTWGHVGAGAALDLVVRGPWVTKTWRNTMLKRVAFVVALGALYEGAQLYTAHTKGTLGQAGYGFGLKDLAADAMGAVVAEGLLAVLRRR